jgi:hypothetical protein
MITDGPSCSDLNRRPRCGGVLQVIAAITDSGVIARILDHFGPGWAWRTACAGQLSRTTPRA